MENNKTLLNRDLRNLYYAHKANCCKCGCELSDNTGNGVGSAFVLDKKGNFYCIFHDDKFDDGDENIFEPEFCEESMKDLKNLIQDNDVYNPNLELYAFIYNEDGAICCYNISEDKAIKLNAEMIENSVLYWSELLGPGGYIYTNPEEFFSEYGYEDKWMTTEEFAEIIS